MLVVFGIRIKTSRWLLPNVFWGLQAVLYVFSPMLINCRCNEWLSKTVSKRTHRKTRKLRKKIDQKAFFPVSACEGSCWNLLTKNNYLHWAYKSKYKESFPHNEDQNYPSLPKVNLVTLQHVGLGFRVSPMLKIWFLGTRAHEHTRSAWRSAAGICGVMAVPAGSISLLQGSHGSGSDSTQEDPQESCPPALEQSCS